MIHGFTLDSGGQIILAIDHERNQGLTFKVFNMVLKKIDGPSYMTCSDENHPG